MNITESNVEIDNLVNYLTTKVVSLRAKYPKHTSLGKIRVIYNKIIIPWMDKHHIPNVEVTIDEDEFIKNKILDLINDIDKDIQK